MDKKDHVKLAKCCEYFLVGSIITVVWLVMVLPVIIYFLVSQAIDAAAADIMIII